ncbi:phage regulatory CII family protein [Hydrogenobacter thermophilus]|jgi:hypothetical protein|uniref:phage regulatory CII family protein n=1 Tax=Hydrogenobacter thermophilus TaxID=940 RepID=UPI0030F63D7C
MKDQNFQRELLEALREAVYKSRIPPKLLCFKLGVLPSQLSMMLSEDSLSKYRVKFPLMLLPELIKLTGNYKPLEILCSACGGVFFKLPQNNNRFKDIMDETQELLRYTADLLKGLSDALEDGKITDQEKKMITKCVKKLISLLMAIERTLEENYVSCY